MPIKSKPVTSAILEIPISENFGTTHAKVSSAFFSLKEPHE
jgi:hypothetical protein